MSEYKFECWFPANGETFDDRVPVAAYDHESAAIGLVQQNNTDGEFEEWDVLVVEEGEPEDKAKVFSVMARLVIDYESVELTPVTCKGCSRKFGRSRLSEDVECQKCYSKRAWSEHHERMKEKAK